VITPRRVVTQRGSVHRLVRLVDVVLLLGLLAAGLARGLGALLGRDARGALLAHAGVVALEELPALLVALEDVFLEDPLVPLALEGMQWVRRRRRRRRRGGGGPSSSCT
jgi:hypothetical protein